MKTAIEPSQAVTASAEHGTLQDPVVTKSHQRNARVEGSDRKRANEHTKPITEERTRLGDTEAPVTQAAERYVLQMAALSSEEKAAEIQLKLGGAGISSYTQKTSTPYGDLIRVRVGPVNKDDAEKIRVKLGKLGMGGATTPI